MSEACHYTTTGPLGQDCAAQTEDARGCACGRPPRPPRPPFPPCPPAPPCINPVQEADITCEDGCCCTCAAGLVAALQLLCDPRFAPLVDYDRFVFLTHASSLGSAVECPAPAPAPYDNLTGPLAGRFVGITPNTCEHLRVSGPLYPAVPACAGAGPVLENAELSVCRIIAAVFTVPEPPADVERFADDGPVDPALAYSRLVRLFWQATHGGCPPAPVAPAKPTPCTGGDVSGVRSPATVAAGSLVVGNARVLGEIGDVLILANEADRRFYFICKSAGDFSG